MKKIKWLQISDIHIFSSSKWNIMKKKYYDKLKNEGIEFIIITGDLHQYGKDYSETRAFLEELTSTLGIGKESVYIMPGNHDGDTSVDDSVLDSTEKVWRETAKDPDFYHKRKNKLVSKYNDYCRFLDSFYGVVLAKKFKNVVGGLDVFERKNQLNLICVNSTFVSDGSHDHKEILPIKELSELKINNKYPSIVCTHYNPDDLFESHKKGLSDMMAYINGVAVLCGHRHRSDFSDKTRNTSDTFSRPVITGPKASFENGDDFSDFGFLIHEWDAEIGVVTCKYYIWLENGKNSRFVPDQKHQDEDDNFPTYNMSLPESKKSSVTTKNNSKMNTGRKSDEVDDGLMIWLPDAELARGEQVRFESYSKVGAAKEYIPAKKTAQDTIWGISAIKGAGKTFLLQVKRVKVDNKYFNIPVEKKPNQDNRWATETIRRVTNIDLYGSSITELTQLWLYSIVIHVILTYRIHLLMNKNRGQNQDKLDELTTFINEAKFCDFTKNLLESSKNASLDDIMCNVVHEKNGEEL